MTVVSLFVRQATEVRRMSLSNITHNGKLSAMNLLVVPLSLFSNATVSTVVVQITLITYFFLVTVLLLRMLTEWENRAFVRNKWLFCFLSFVCVF